MLEYDHISGPLVIENYETRDYLELLKVIRNGIRSSEITVRGLKTTERQLVTITTSDFETMNRLHFTPGRWENPTFGYAEGLFILLGYAKVEPYAWYAPEMAHFADDNTDFFHGAYGPRLGTTNWWKSDDFGRQEWLNSQASWHLSPINQLEAVYRKLKKDPTTRQAIMTIWNPALDNEPHKDIPCTNLFHFLLRDGRLDLTVYMRSQDLMTGFVYDTQQFKWLQEILCGWLSTYETRILPGHYNHILGSAHIYHADFPKIRKMKSSPNRKWKLYDVSKPLFCFDTSYDDWMRLIKLLAEIELKSRKGKLDEASNILLNNSNIFNRNTFYLEIAYSILSVNHGKYGETRRAIDAAESILGDLRIPTLCRSLAYHHQKTGELETDRFQLFKSSKSVIKEFVKDKSGKLKMVD